MAVDLSAYPITGKYRLQLEQLHQERLTWISHWTELQENIYPRKGKYLHDEDQKKRDEGLKRSQYVINGTPGEANDVLAAGMQGGLTSPSRPWFRLGLADEKLMDSIIVREWLQAVRDLLLDIFARSNFYGAMHNIYEEIGAFGTAVMLIEEDLDSVIRCRPFTVGEYYLALDRKYRPTTLYRKYTMSARNIVAEFGEENCSDTVREMAKNPASSEKEFTIVHCIRPRSDRSAGRLDASNMPFESVYYEDQAENDVFLRKGGYTGLPFLAPRWFVRGVSTYGRSPGMTALGDCKQLQKMEDDKLWALSVMIKPPMNAPSSMKKQGGGTIVSAGINFLDVAQGMQGFVPTYQINPDFQNIAFEIDRVENRIRRNFNNHLFQSIIAAEKQMTAREVTERSAEKLVLLGPVLERLHTEALSVAIDRTMSIADRFNLLPEPPLEIQGQPLKVEYISLLAQAQKVLGLTNIDTFIGFVGNMAQLYPEALDAVDVDDTINKYAEDLGVPVTIITDEKQRNATRAARQQQIEQAQQLEAAQQGAETAKTLSDTSLSEGNDNALQAIIGGIAG